MELSAFAYEENKQNDATNELRFENINYSAIDAKGKKKHIVSGVSGRALSKDVFAILGPSGKWNMLLEMQL
jgi:ABC-type multidrug transport system ATPase subunit